MQTKMEDNELHQKVKEIFSNQIRRIESEGSPLNRKLKEIRSTGNGREARYKTNGAIPGHSKSKPKHEYFGGLRCDEKEELSDDNDSIDYDLQEICKQKTTPNPNREQSSKQGEKHPRKAKSRRQNDIEEEKLKLEIIDSQISNLDSPFSTPPLIYGQRTNPKIKKHYVFKVKEPKTAKMANRPREIAAKQKGKTKMKIFVIPPEKSEQKRIKFETFKTIPDTGEDSFPKNMKLINKEVNQIKGEVQKRNKKPIISKFQQNQNMKNGNFDKLNKKEKGIAKTPDFILSQNKPRSRSPKNPNRIAMMSNTPKNKNLNHNSRISNLESIKIGEMPVFSSCSDYSKVTHKGQFSLDQNQYPTQLENQRSTEKTPKSQILGAIPETHQFQESALTTNHGHESKQSLSRSMRDQLDKKKQKQDARQEEEEEQEEIEEPGLIASLQMQNLFQNSSKRSQNFGSLAVQKSFKSLNAREERKGRIINPFLTQSEIRNINSSKSESKRSLQIINIDKNLDWKSSEDSKNVINSPNQVDYSQKMGETHIKTFQEDKKSDSSINKGPSNQESHVEEVGELVESNVYQRVKNRYNLSSKSIYQVTKGIKFGSSTHPEINSVSSRTSFKCSRGKFDQIKSPKKINQNQIYELQFSTKSKNKYSRGVLWEPIQLMISI